MNKELNKKLAEWAGFTSKIVTSKSADFNGTYLAADGKFKKMPDTYSRTLWHDPDIAPYSGCRDYWYAENGVPNFPESLDACFKWLLQPLCDHFIKRSSDYAEFQQLIADFLTAWVRDFIFNEHYHGKLEPYAEALALCLAIEKLIDSEGGV